MGDFLTDEPVDKLLQVRGGGGKGAYLFADLPVAEVMSTQTTTVFL